MTPVRSPIAAYLVELAADLAGPPRMRRTVIAELEDGLRCAAERHRAAGGTTVQAEAAAIEEFGAPAVVARAFAPELAAAQARRFALALVRSGPLVGALWLIPVLLAAPHPQSHGPVWRHAATSLIAVTPVLPVAIAATAFAAAIAVATTGRGLRLFRGWDPIARRAAGAAALAAAAGDVALLTSAPGIAGRIPAAALPLVLVAAAVSALRLVASAWCTRRCLLPGPPAAVPSPRGRVDHRR